MLKIRHDVFHFRVSFTYNETTGDTQTVARKYYVTDRTRNVVVGQTMFLFFARVPLPSVSEGRQQLIVSLSRYVEHPSPRINYVTAATSPRATLPALLIILPSFHRRSFIFTFSFSCVVLRPHRTFAAVIYLFLSAFRRCFENWHNHAFVSTTESTCSRHDVADSTRWSTRKRRSTGNSSRRLSTVSVLEFLFSILLVYIWYLLLNYDV